MSTTPEPVAQPEREQEYAPGVAIERVEKWRSPLWFDDVPSRPGYLLTCNICGPIGEDRGGNVWAYGNAGAARGAAIKHERKHAAGAC